MKKKIIHMIVSICRLLFLISFSYVLLYPLLYLIVHTLQSPADYFDPTIQWVPKNITFENIKLGIQVMEFWKGLGASMVMIGCAFLQIISCGITAYGIARFRFKGQKLVTGLVILNILVPSAMLIIPNYLNFKNLDFLGILGLVESLIGVDLTVNLLNTPFVFILPAIFGVGLQSGIIIYIFIQFFKSFPKELEEAAWLDGLGPLGTFFRIVVPSSREVVLTTSILSVVWHWNEYYLPSVYWVDSKPLAVKVRNIFMIFYDAGFGDKNGTAVNGAMAGVLLFLIPPLIMYLILQKKFIKSIAGSGIVG